MKALTLWPEWAWAVLNLDKRVENRVWKAPESMIGERFAIHAGKHIGGKPGGNAERMGIADVIYMAEEAGWDTHSGMSTSVFFRRPDKSVVMYLGYNQAAYQSYMGRGEIVGVATLDRCTALDETAWSVPGQYHFHLTDVQRLEKPIPARGFQKFWNLTGEQEKEVLRQIYS